jgi:hypothetical protein
MSEPTLQAVRDPSVWRADEIGGKAGLLLRLDAGVIAGLRELLETTADRPVLELRPEHFRHPAIEELARDCRRELAHGRGAVVLTGLDPELTRLENFRRIYWFVGQLIGRPVAQSDKGDVIGYVRQEPTQTIRRGYTSNVELGFHTDFHELLSLASVGTALEGGESGLVSSGYLHNVLLAERPDLLRALYAGWYDAIESFWYDRLRPKEALGDEMMPYFSLAEGRLSFQNSVFAYIAAEERGEPVPAALGEAQAAIAEIAERPGVAARFLLEPGEMVFWHNYAVMHGRREFTNAPGHERLLMRLWLHAHDKRPAAAHIGERVATIDRIVAELHQRASETAAA